MFSDNVLRIKLLDNYRDLPFPEYQQGDSGLPLYITDDLELYPYKKVRVGHGIAIQLPCDTDQVVTTKGAAYKLCLEGNIRPRSSSLYVRDIEVEFGTIDRNYRGELSTVLTWKPPMLERVTAPMIIKRGERLSQLVISVIMCPIIMECNDLSVTVRGDKGFGQSTGR